MVFPILFPPEPELPLSPRAKQVVQRVATTILVGCLLGLVALRLELTPF